jgi:hypothetical protein
VLGDPPSLPWVRSYRGRTKWQTSAGTYERERPRLVGFDSVDPDHDPVGHAVGDGGLDDDAHRVSDQLRALDKRSRRPGRRDEQVGYDQDGASA